MSGAFPLTQEAFDSLEKRNGETDDSNTRLVTVRDNLKENQGILVEQSLSQALEDPHVIDFFGSEKRAEVYFNGYRKVFGNKTYIWHSNDLGQIPVARPLVLRKKMLGGDNFSVSNGLFGVCPANLDNITSQ